MTMMSLKRIKNIKKYLTTESFAKVVVSLCMPHLVYSNSILSGLPDCKLIRCNISKIIVPN